jgi:hypothetical protein
VERVQLLKAIEAVSKKKRYQVHFLFTPGKMYLVPFLFVSEAVDGIGHGCSHRLKAHCEHGDPECGRCG